MNRGQEEKRRLPGSNLVLAMILATYGVMLAYLLLDLRKQLREEALARISAGTTPTLNEFFRQAEEEALALDLDYLDLNVESLFHTPSEILEETALRALELPEVEGSSAFSREGSEIASYSTSVNEETPSKKDFELARQSTLSRFSEPNQLTLLVPVGEGAGAGFIRIERDGSSFSAERKTLDENLVRQGMFAFAGGGGLIVILFLTFMQRLRRSQEILDEQTEKLAESNRRLAQACKAAGVGAVTSHLMHALKNPLAGIQDIAKEQRDAITGGDTAELLTEAANRMQAIVEETLGTLSEAEVDEASYSFNATEILDLVRKRIEPNAEEAGVKLEATAGETEIEVNNLRANLLVPILIILSQNAIEASSRGLVELEVGQEGENLEFRVKDDGKGVSEEVRGLLFRPVQSSKPGGSGVGLAICRELSQRIDAEISLESSDPNGSCFLVRVETKKTTRPVTY